MKKVFISLLLMISLLSFFSIVTKAEKVNPSENNGYSYYYFIYQEASDGWKVEYTIRSDSEIVYYLGNNNYPVVVGYDGSNLVNFYSCSQRHEKLMRGDGSVYYDLDVTGTFNWRFNEIEFDKYFKHFSNETAALSYFSDGDNSGWINKPAINLDSDGKYDGELPIPKVKLDFDTLEFQIENSSYDLFLEIQGRWYSVDDITLYKDSLTWKVKYDSIIKSPLEVWADTKDQMCSVGKYNFKELGDTTWNNFINKYPPSSRHYLNDEESGSWISNKFSGYSDMRDMMDTVHLPNKSSYLNGLEVYIRFYYFDAQGIGRYSKWTHLWDSLSKPTGSTATGLDSNDIINQSQNGLMNDQLFDLELQDNTFSDPDAKPSYDPHVSDDILDPIKGMYQLGELVDGTINLVGQIPNYINRVINWLPSWIVNLIGCCIGFIALLRILGR